MDIFGAMCVFLAVLALITGAVLLEECFDRWYRRRDDEIHRDLDIWGGH